MTRWLAVLCLVVSGAAGAQPVLHFRKDLAFQAGTVNSFAARAYGDRVRKLNAEHKLDQNEALLKRVRRIVHRLRPAAAYERPAMASLGWEVHVCRRCFDNASAMAGGKLMVGEEFIARIKPTDSELAFLLAHEMGHVLAEHTREFATTARSFVGMGMKREYSDIQHEIDESLGLQLRMAPLYKRQELEADYVGLVLGCRAGFEPHAMLTLLHKLDTPGQSVVDVHPSGNQRIGQAEGLMPQAERIYSEGVPQVSGVHRSLSD